MQQISDPSHTCRWTNICDAPRTQRRKRTRLIRIMVCRTKEKIKIQPRGQALQAASSRVRSSSDRNRSRPRGSRGFRTLRMGEFSSHSHSLTASENVCDRDAIYRTTVAGDIGLFRLVWVASSSSRHWTMVAAVTSQRSARPSLPFHHSKCRFVLQAFFGL